MNKLNTSRQKYYCSFFELRSIKIFNIYSSFFPNVLQPPLAVVGNTVFALLVRMRICKRPIRRYDVGIGGPAISISLPGVDNNAGAGPDTERRRQVNIAFDLNYMYQEFILVVEFNVKNK